MKWGNWRMGGDPKPEKSGLEKLPEIDRLREENRILRLVYRRALDILNRKDAKGDVPQSSVSVLRNLLHETVNHGETK